MYLQLGSSGKQVKILQNRLIVLGYLTGTADGEYSETTYAAVMAFQKRNSIYADGVGKSHDLNQALFFFREKSGFRGCQLRLAQGRRKR